ncbi:hypothetical protein Mapa_013537 [Marchantia paleacea]|nr:hypothetical protein Mapa_013537 [Marchantia paleacea]
MGSSRRSPIILGVLSPLNSFDLDSSVDDDVDIFPTAMLLGTSRIFGSILVVRFDGVFPSLLLFYCVSHFRSVVWDPSLTTVR